MNTKNILFIILSAFLPFFASAQTNKPFQGTIYNAEYQVYIQMDFYEKDIEVPEQEIFGSLPGYLGAQRDTRKWLITDISLTKPTSAHLSIINDYGSEDLEATLSYEKDGTYVLIQDSGSVLKIARNRKWVKIPKKLVFTRR